MRSREDVDPDSLSITLSCLRRILREFLRSSVREMELGFSFQIDCQKLSFFFTRSAVLFYAD